MGKKEETPFQIAIKENDTLKKSIDKYIKSSESHTKKKNPDRRETKELYDRCTGHIAEIESQIEHVTELTQEDEPSMKESKFNTKQKDELKKLNLLKERLAKLKEKLKPDETEEGYFEDMKKEHEDDEADDEDDEESEDDEEDDFDDEEYSEDEEPLIVKKSAEAKDSARSQKSGKNTTEVVKKTEKKKEILEEEYEESEDEDFSEDDEDDMTDVTEEGERSKPQQHTTPRKHQQQAEDDEEEGETDEDDDEDDDEGLLDSEEDDENEEEDEAEGPLSHRGTNRQYIAQVDFDAEEEGDLGFHEGEILTILAARTDGWLEAENSAGQKGLVPITYLKVYNKYKSLEKPVDEEEDETEEEDSEEDGESPRSPKTPRSGRKLWENIKQAVKETSVTDVLHAMGAVPSGFRESTLAKLLTEEHCTMKAYLAPKLSPSCVSYRDLFIDSTTNRIRMRASRLLRIVQLVSARQIPAPGTGIQNEKTGQKEEFDEAKGLDIKSRHVRVCLFDGHSMLSNIHTMAVVSVDKDQKTWHFSTKMNDNMKSLDFGECFVRSNTTDTNIGILFELGMSYVRRSTQQSGEFSCGWVFLPLFDNDGRPAEFKTYEEFVSGGTPFEKGVDVDPSVGRRENSSMFRSLVGGNKQPQLNFRLLSPTKDQKELLDTLPDVLISSTVYIQYLSFYRQILTDTLIRDNEDLLTCDNVHNAVLTAFPAVSDQSDLMDALRQAWAEKMKTVKRAEKKDPDMMKEQFKKVFMESVYPLVHASHLPQYKLTDPENIQTRTLEIKKLQKLNKEKKIVASLLSSDRDLKPFDVNELAFNVMGPYCVAHKHRVS